MRPKFSYVHELGLPAFVLVPNENGQWVYAECNDLWLVRTNLTRDQISGKTAGQVFPGSVGQQCDQEHAVAANKKKRCGYQMPLHVSDQKSAVSVSMNPVIRDDGQISHLVGLWTDTAPTGAVKSTAATIEALMPEMEAFVSFAAHDLRTPMRQVHSLAELLREDFEDLGDGKLELIDMLEDVAVKASGLVTEILAQTQASTAVEDRTRFDLAPLWDDIVAVIDPRGRHTLTAPEMTLVTDRIAVQIGLRNLVDNAIKHGERAKMTLRLNVRETTQGMLLSEVFDNGKGFRDPTIAFLDGGTLKVDSGYGLFGIKRLIQSRGGTISAENLEDGQGSVVRFTLPGFMDDAFSEKVAATR